MLDRAQPFGHRGRLDYGIVANWAIAEHKSQGTMQLHMGTGGQEHYFVFEVGPTGARQRAAAFFADLDAAGYPTTGTDGGPNSGTDG